MECRICYESVTEDNIETLECMHSLCQICLGQLRRRLCPFCRTPIGSASELLPLTREIDPPSLRLPPPRLLHLDMEVLPLPRRRRRRRRARRRRPSSSSPPIRAPMNIDPSVVEEMRVTSLNERVDENETKNSISDKYRQCRRRSRNRWKEFRNRTSRTRSRKCIR